MAKHMSMEERFLQKVNKTETCWLWTGALNSRGYGAIGVNGKSVSAHRFSYETYIEKIPNGMIVCHTCDIRNCVNPEHLWVGTNADNNKDMFAKNRNGSSTRRRTHCRKGHSFEVVGVYERKKKNGKIDRVCRECQRVASFIRRRNPKTRESLLKYQRDYQREYYHKNKKSGSH